MKSRHLLPEELTQLADLQAGVLSREQVHRFLGDSVVRRLLGEGRWRRLSRGVYATRTAPDSFETLAWAGVLAAGPGAMLGEHAAALVQGVWREDPPIVTVLVPHGNTTRLGHPWRLVRRRHLPRPRGSLPLTPPEWTVLDLCDVEPVRTVNWVTSALRNRLVSPRSLARALDERARISRTPLPTRDLLEKLLADAQGLESPLEHIYATRVERAHGLPHGVRQARLGRTRQDVRYDGLVVELDGRLGHDDTESIFREMSRDNASSMEGLFSHRYGYDDCWYRPCETAFQVATKLRQLGWTGQPHPCPSCRKAGLWRGFGLP
ncbi:MAG TPA: type IV toxin-antitoxin system AbiEi family antitoxin domain-containing protein [Candidatus Luteococcus avicola]|nr:type IV toxin-antitoxin system AbiEi family antitoxin domain-containing protein [Candidatus Luteococcus avicola]